MNEHYPNTYAVATKLSSNRSTQKQRLLDYRKTCVKLACDYFQQEFDNDLKVAVSIFNYACYFDPGKIGELKPSCSDIDNLLVILDLSYGAVLVFLRKPTSYYGGKITRVNCPIGLLPYSTIISYSGEGLLYII